MKFNFLFAAATLFIAGNLTAQTWEYKEMPARFNNTNLETVHFFDDKNGLIAGDNGLIAKTTDGGSTWDSIPSGVNSTLWEFYFLNRNVGWLSGYGKVLKTTDGGSTWSNVSGDLDSGYNYTDIYFADENNGFVTGHQVYRTSNGGKNWTKLTSSGIFKHSLGFTSITNGFLCANSGVLAKRINNSKGGDSFQVLSSPIGNDLYGMHAINDSSIIAAGSSGAILLTTNYGKNWYTKTNAATHAFIDVHGPDQTNFWAVGTSGKIYYSGNGGQSWSLQNGSYSNAEYRDVHMVNAYYGWVVGKTGMMMKFSNCAVIDKTISDLGGTVKANAINVKYIWNDCDTELPVPNATGQYFTPSISGSYYVNLKYDQCSVFSNCVQIWAADVKNNSVQSISLAPNPANDVVWVKNTTSGQSINIINSSGAVVYSLTANSNESLITTAAFSNGLYFVKVSADGYSQIQRLLINR